MKQLLLLFLFSAATAGCFGQSSVTAVTVNDGSDLTVPRSFSIEISNAPDWALRLAEKVRTQKGFAAKLRKENPRLVAIALTLLLGPFGAHRIYLGTSEIVPVFYTLTLGGGVGLIPFIDLIHLIAVKDLSRFMDNPKVLMWGSAE